MSPVRINIDGRELTAYPGKSILEVARENGISIPTLCQSGDLKVYGSCGICLVEIEGIPKLFRSCGTAVGDGMIIRTNSKKIRDARRLALELILSDHRGDCSAPCLKACPVNCDAQGYTALIADGKFREALALIMEYVPFASTIGRICPALCEEACRRELVDEPISIRAIKRFVGDLNLKSKDPYVPPVAPDTNRKIAIVGGGPSGLTAAYFLRRAGHQVSLFEALPHLGGMLRYGIPEYRLPNAILDQEIKAILDLGILARTDYALGEDYTLEQLREKGYDAIYLAIGAQSSKGMGVEGEDTKGVLGGAEFLRDYTMGKEVSLGEKVMVVGGGNTAMDAARTARRLGSEVMVVYRRAREQMPAQDIEVEEAEEEGVKFYLLANPVKIEGNGSVERVVCQRMRLGEADSSGRARPEPIPGDFFTLEVDTIIAAIGQDVVTAHLHESIDRSRWNTIQVQEGTFLTSRPGVFAGGDAVTGPAIAIDAVAAGKRAAQVISNYLEGVLKPYDTSYDSVIKDLTGEDFKDREKEHRAKMPTREPDIRVKDFFEVELGLVEEDAKKDASRCLECGCFDRFECKLRQYATDEGILESRITGEEHDYQEEGEHPFIIQDRNKCILCGLCVRTCTEVVGASALGFVNRGFHTYVSPALELPLKETTCVSCGQCVYVCPTGALMERIPFNKPAPFEYQTTASTCGVCGVGCSLEISTLDQSIARITPLEGPVNKGYLCKKGRFGFSYVNDDQRLKTPLVRKDGQLTQVSWTEALKIVGQRMMTIKERTGGDSLALFAGPSYSNEELYLIQKLGRAILGTPNMNSLGLGENPAQKILGLSASTVSFDELERADFILSVGVGRDDYPISCHHLKKAARNCNNLWVLDEEGQGLEEEAFQYLPLFQENTTDLLLALLVAVVEKDLFSKDEGELDSLIQTLKTKNLQSLLAGSSISSQDVFSLVEAYSKAKNPVMVLGTNRLTKEAQALLLNLAILLGALGGVRKGIILLRDACNSQGLYDMGIAPDYLPGYQPLTEEVLKSFSSYWDAPYLPQKEGKDTQEVLSAIKEGKIKGLLVFGEDPSLPVVSQLSSVDFLVVSDLFLTDLAREADVVLPMASFAETKGSFTNSERRIQKVEPAIKPLSGKDNLDLIQGLMEVMGSKKRVTVKEVYNEMRLLIPILSSVSYEDRERSSFWKGKPSLAKDDLGELKPFLPEASSPLLTKRKKQRSLDTWLERFWEEKGIT